MPPLVVASAAMDPTLVSSGLPEAATPVCVEILSEAAVMSSPVALPSVKARSATIVTVPPVVEMASLMFTFQSSAALPSVLASSVMLDAPVAVIPPPAASTVIAPSATVTLNDAAARSTSLTMTSASASFSVKLKAGSVFVRTTALMVLDVAAPLMSIESVAVSPVLF